MRILLPCGLLINRYITIRVVSIGVFTLYPIGELLIYLYILSVAYLRGDQGDQSPHTLYIPIMQKFSEF